MDSYTVTVTGATGKTGRHVAALAASRGWRVRAAVRHRGGGDAVAFDWRDATTWQGAFAGSDAAYVVVPFTAPDVPAKAPELLAAAVGAGVSRIVLLSSLDAADAPPSDPLRRAELSLAQLPVPWAVLRPTWFLDNFTTGRLAAMTAAGQLRLPAGDAAIPFVDVRDVAAVAVAALAEDGPTGILPITGPEAVDHHRVAAALGDAFGRAVRYTPVTAVDFVEALAAAGLPRAYGEFLAAALVDAAEGRLRIPVSDTVDRLTGRRPFTVADFARHAAAEAAASGGSPREYPRPGAGLSHPTHDDSPETT